MSYIEALTYIHEYIKTPSMTRKLEYLQKLLLCHKQYRLEVLNNKENLEYIKKVEGSYRILLMAALIENLITWRKGTQFDGLARINVSISAKNGRYRTQKH
ncbi:hypothetical protein [Francisella sp. W12-1067]